MSIVLKHRRGLESVLPTLAEAELWFSKDSYKLFIGSAAGNQGIAMLASPTFTGTLETPSVTIGGPLFVQSTLNPFMTSYAYGEAVFLMDGSRCDVWWLIESSPGVASVCHSHADDPMCETWIPDNAGFALPVYCRFPYVFKVGSTYYLLVNKLETGFQDDLYLFSSSDKNTWSIMNGGNPVLTHSTNPADWNYMLFNPAIAVVGSTLHLLIEAKSSTNPGWKFDTGYSYSTLADGPNFNTHLSAAPILTNAASPDLIYVPDRNALLTIYTPEDAVLTTFPLRAAYCLLSSNPALPASWLPAPGFGYYVPGIDISDPSIVFSSTSDKPWKMMIAYNYNQGNPCQMYAQTTINQLYDLATNPTGTDVGLTMGMGRQEIDAVDFGHFGTARITTDANDNLSFLTADAGETLTSRMIISKAGKVGIGTAAPTYGLDVQGSGLAARIQAKEGFYVAWGASVLTPSQVGSTGATTFSIKTNDANRITINGTGYIWVYNLPVFANNAAALAGGFSAGGLYRTNGDPDQVCVVH